MKKLFCDENGNIMVISALVFPVLFLLTGLAIDYSRIAGQKAKLQNITDASVLAAAKEMRVRDYNDPYISDVGYSLAKSIATQKFKLNADHLKLDHKINKEERSIAIRITYPANQIFGLLDWGNKDLTVESEAKLLGSLRVCVVALDSLINHAIFLTRRAVLDAKACAVYSNSSANQAIRIDDAGKMKADLICTVGDYFEMKGAYSPEPVRDCPVFEDPLSDRIEPTSGGCTEEKLVLTGGVHILEPGTYCGGIWATNGAQVKFNPGTYIITDGNFRVDKEASITGEYTSFYLKNSEIKFDFDSHISLTASKEGDLAGILFFESRNSKGRHNIKSDDARVLLGTIYLKNGTLTVDANKPVADKSAYTALVVNQLLLHEGPTLVLNTNYGASDVPVPEKIKGMNSNIVLVR